MASDQLSFNFDDSGEPRPGPLPHESMYAEVLTAVDPYDITNLIDRTAGETLATDLTGWSQPDRSGTRHQVEAYDTLYLATQRARSAKGETPVAREVYQTTMRRLKSRERHDMRVLVALAQFRGLYDEDGVFYEEDAAAFREAIDDPDNRITGAWGPLFSLIENSGLSVADAERLKEAAMTTASEGDRQDATDLFEAMDSIMNVRYAHWQRRQEQFMDAMARWNHNHPEEADE